MNIPGEPPGGETASVGVTGIGCNTVVVGAWLGTLLGFELGEPLGGVTGGVGVTAIGCNTVVAGDWLGALFGFDVGGV